IALKCMDGRLNLSVATNTPPGIIEPIRNLGGRFDLGWPHFGEVITEQVQSMADMAAPRWYSSITAIPRAMKNAAVPAGVTTPMPPVTLHTRALELII
ncbi:MAG: hypothetical protein HXY51_08495, partial [Nitrospirae bacterium]|nr:hypothetical protein [Nitrospirota bacterium]